MLSRAASTCIHLHKGDEKVIYRPQTACLLIHIDHYIGWLIVSLSLCIYEPAECGKLRPICRLICSGMSLLISSGDAPANCSRSFHCRMIKILFGCWILFTIQIYEKLLIGCPCVWFGSCRTDGKVSSHTDIHNEQWTKQQPWHVTFNKKNTTKIYTSCLKLKSGGSGWPLGRRAFGSRSSSKKGCAHASSWNNKSHWWKLCQLS